MIRTKLTEMLGIEYPIVQGCVLVLSLFVMCINLLVDLAYKWIDPRVSLE